MSVPVWIAVVIAGAVGAPARYLLDDLVRSRIPGDRPWGTFVVNIVGSFLLGAFTGLSLQGRLGHTTMQVLGVGFCGAFTTFSTFSYESVRLIEAGDTGQAVLNVVGSLVVGLVAAAAGLAIATFA